MTQTCSPRRVLLSMLCAALAFFAVPLWDVDSALAQVRNPHGVAVIIGNKNYTGTGQVRFAHRDAKAFRRYVVGVLGFDPDNVIHLKDATQAQMVGLFGNRHDPKGKVWFYLDPDEGRKVSDVVVYYSGHGMPGLDNKTPGAYLLPTDANPNNPRLNGYSIDVLYRNLAKLPARSVSVFLDACFTGQAGDGQAILKASPIIRVAALPDSVAKNMTVLTAARKNQLAYWDEKSRHGMFTHHLLDALYGKGDADGDGKVTAQEVQALPEELHAPRGASALPARPSSRTARWKRQGRGGSLGGVFGGIPGAAVSGRRDGGREERRDKNGRSRKGCEGRSREKGSRAG